MMEGGKEKGQQDRLSEAFQRKFARYVTAPIGDRSEGSIFYVYFYEFSYFRIFLIYGSWEAGNVCKILLHDVAIILDIGRFILITFIFCIFAGFIISF